MSNSSYTFIYDGLCPFCNHFAELLEIKSKIKNLTILDGRKNLEIIKNLLEKGYDLDNGAILLKDNKILHGSGAVNEICNHINKPSGQLLKIITSTFKSNTRARLLFPFLILARRVALTAKGISTSLI